MSERAPALSDAEWLALLCDSIGHPVAAPWGGWLPGFPSEKIQTTWVGSSGEAAIRSAWHFAALCITRFEALPGWRVPDKTLLDFGTGWGRVARCFLRDFSPEAIIGVDINHEMIELCQSGFSGSRFAVCSPLPPLDLSAASIDFIVSYSVFSHLSEEACKAWIAEFARLLKPGGMVALTTRPRWFFDYAQSLAGEDATGYRRALSQMFPDFDAARAAYDHGEFVHTTAGLGGDPIYGETFIPERYAREAYAKHLNLIEFSEDHEEQPILFFRHRAQAECFRNRDPDDST